MRQTQRTKSHEREKRMKKLFLLILLLGVPLCWGQGAVTETLNWSTASCTRTQFTASLSATWNWQGSVGGVNFNCNYQNVDIASQGSPTCVSQDEMTWGYQCNNRCCTWIDVSPQPTLDVYYANGPCGPPAQPTSPYWIILHQHS